jgi:fluoroquinolone resistance protein
VLHAVEPTEPRVIDQAAANQLIRDRVEAAFAEGGAAEIPEFRRSNLDGVSFGRARLRGCNLSDLPAARLSAESAVFEDCGFQRTYLRHAHLKSARLERCDLTEADAAAAFAVGASFRGSILERTKFELAWLDGVDFAETRCQETVFRRAHLRGAKRAGVTLAGCHFDDADLRDANLTGCDLREARLAGTDLRRANLSRARLERPTSRTRIYRARTFGAPL